MDSDFIFGRRARCMIYLLVAIVSSSLGASFLNPFFHSLLNFSGPLEWMSLSWQGLRHWWLWQPFTYLFLLLPGGEGLTFFYLIDLLFQLTLLHVLGNVLVYCVGSASFIRFYFITGVVSGLMAACMMPLTGPYTPLTGVSSMIVALLTLWTCFFPKKELWLLFLVPIEARWVWIIVLSIISLATLSQGQWPLLFLYWSATICAYFSAILIWGVQGPFKALHFFEEKMRRGALHFTALSYKKDKTKIIDIQTGQKPLSDDAFIDAMLEKISKKGSDSLTWHERKRMDQISKRKARA